MSIIGLDTFMVCTTMLIWIFSAPGYVVITGNEYLMPQLLVATLNYDLYSYRLMYNEIHYYAYMFQLQHTHTELYMYFICTQEEVFLIRL